MDARVADTGGSEEKLHGLVLWLYRLLKDRYPNIMDRVEKKAKSHT